MTYYPYPPNYYQRPPESNGLSVASLVLGILSMLGFGIFILVPLAGVITGHLGYRREPSSRALSVAGLITSWVALALCALFYIFIIWMIIAIPENFSDYSYDEYSFEDLNYS